LQTVEAFNCKGVKFVQCQHQAVLGNHGSKE
jgi:hypothetical protein